MSIVAHSVALLATLLAAGYVGLLLVESVRRQRRMVELHEEERAVFRARLEAVREPVKQVAATGAQTAWSGYRKFRLEGKEYVVKDGDIVHIRANTR